MASDTDRRLFSKRNLLPLTLFYALFAVDPAFAEEAYASTDVEYAQAAPQQQPLHQQPAAPNYGYQRYEYTDNDASYQPYRAPAAPVAGQPAQGQPAQVAPTYQAPVYQEPAQGVAQAAPQQPVDNDNYYEQYRPAAGGNPPIARTAPTQAGAPVGAPVSGNAAPQGAYSDNDSSYNAKNHFYDPMYDY